MAELASRCAMKALNTHCTSPPTKRVQVGCVHEHMMTGCVCDDHARLIEDHARLIESGLEVIRCHFCAKGDDPHRCMVIGRVIA